MLDQFRGVITNHDCGTRQSSRGCSDSSGRSNNSSSRRRQIAAHHVPGDAQAQLGARWSSGDSRSSPNVQHRGLDTHAHAHRIGGKRSQGDDAGGPRQEAENEGEKNRARKGELGRKVERAGMRSQLGAVEAWNKRICHLNGGGREGQRRADLGSGWKRHESVPKEHRRPDVLTRPGRKSFTDIGQRLKFRKAKARSTMKDQGGAVPPVLAAAGAEAKCSACLVLPSTCTPPLLQPSCL